MSENKYGNLLDKYMEKESNNSNKILNDFTRSKKEEGKGKYGTLLYVSYNLQMLLLVYLYI